MRRVRTVAALIAIIHLILYTLLPPGTPGMGNTALAAGSNGPVLLSTSPADNATGVSTNTQLKLTFDEPVLRGIGTAAVTIRKVLDNSLVESYVTATNTTNISISSNVVTITPSPNKLQPNTDYYVTIDPGAFRNSTGADYAGLTDGTAWNFTTGVADSTAPTLAAHSQQVQVGEPIMLHFSEPVFAASGSIQLANTADTTDIRSIPVTDPQVSGSGTASISILPSIPLRGGASYRLIVPNTAFVDAAGNRFAGTTASTGPVVHVIGSSLQHTGFDPADDSTGVAPGTTTLKIYFNRNVDKGSGNKKITVKNLITNLVTHTVDVNSGAVSKNGSEVTIQLTGGLQANTSYYVLIDPGAFVEEGNPSVLYAGITDAVTWNFTTMPGTDVTKPTIVELTPADDSVHTSLAQTIKIRFSEPVYPGSGDITIRNLYSDAVFDIIPVTSNRVSGFGTDTISIQVASPFGSNQSYYVNISPQAFRDAAGNLFDGITNKTSWNFSVTLDVTPPTIASMTPATGLNSVPVNQVFKLTFSEAVRFKDGSNSTDKIVIRGTRSNTSPVATLAEIDTDGKTLVIKPWSYATNQQVNLQQSTSYYIEIPAGIITDMAGNEFGGILNEYTWTFGTVGSDRTAPSIQSAAVSGSNRIILTYNEPLDETKVPPTGSFYVTANDIRLNVTGVSVSGQTVILTLQTGVVYGQNIKLYYTRSDPAIQDLSGNLAANLTNYAVKNESGATQTAPLSGSVTGGVLTLTFNSTLQPVHSLAYQQFGVYVGGTYIAPSAISSSGSVITLTLSSEVKSGHNVYVNYSPGSYPIKDVAGNAVAAFSNFAVRNALDNTAPVLQFMQASGNTVLLVYNEALDSNSVPRANQFVVMESGVTRTISSVSVSGSTVVLTLSASLANNQNVIVSYLGGSPALRDLAGNNAAAFANQPVTNNLVSINLTGATVSGNTVLLYFNQSLKTTNLPSASQFTVKENGTARPIIAVSVNDSILRLDLGVSISSGSTVTVSYSPSTAAMLQSTTGIPVPAFSDYAIGGSGNTGGGSSGVDLGGNYETAVGGGVNIKTQAASVSSRTSAGGRSANRYTLSSSVLTDAYNLSASRFSRYRVTFTVPSTQAAAMVEVPVDAVIRVKGQSNQASFAVVYGDIVYEVPFRAFDDAVLAEAVRKYGQVYLLIEIDKGNVGQASKLRSALSQNQMLMISDAYAFNLSFVSGSRNETGPVLKDYAVMELTISGSLDSQQHTAVWLDPNTGKVAYVPTSIRSQGNTSVVTFKHKANDAYAVIRYNATYSDIPANHWARKDLQILLNKLIIEGRTAQRFDPNQPITRAEFAEFIVRGLGLEGDADAAKVFRDLGTSSNKAAYIGAAYKANIVAGVSEGRFEPNSLITREQMASMMVRAARAAGVEILLSRNQSDYLVSYGDYNALSAWARGDMARAVEAKIISGISGNRLGPQNNATRAEAAVMIKRLLEYVKLM